MSATPASVAAEEDAQKAKKQCTVFEPQAWRKTLCRNCFKTKNDHSGDSDSDAGDRQKKSTSPVLVSDGDVVILRREGTPYSSRGGTPAASSTPASPAATPAGDKNILVSSEQITAALDGKENDGGTSKDSPSDKKKDKTNSKTSDVDKSSVSSKTPTATNAKKVQAKNETASSTVGLEKTEKTSADQAKNKNRDDGRTSRVGASKSVIAQQSTGGALSQRTQHKVDSGVDIRGEVAAVEAPTTSASEPIAVGEAVSSSAADIKSPSDDGAAQTQPAVESSAAESGYRDNASSAQAMPASEGQSVDGTAPAVASHEDGSSSSSSSSSNIITGRADDAAVAAAAASSDEMIGDAAKAERADDTKIDRGSGERPAAAEAESPAGEDAAVGTGAGGVVSAAGLSEDSQSVRQLDPTPPPDQRACSTVVPGGVPGGRLFTNDDDLAKGADSGASDAASSSISGAAADQSGVASVQQPSNVDAGSAYLSPEVTSSDGGAARVEATITLGGLSSPYVVDSGRPIHVVSVADYQHAAGVWTVPQNVEDFERGRQPPDYDQSAGYSWGERAPSISSDDEYGPTSPLVDYLSRSPFARPPPHGATERSPETEIVATGGGGETSLFHHVPAAGDVSGDNGSAARPAANTDTDNRLRYVYVTPTLQ